MFQILKEKVKAKIFEKQDKHLNAINYFLKLNKNL